MALMLEWCPSLPTASDSGIIRGGWQAPIGRPVAFIPSCQ